MILDVMITDIRFHHQYRSYHHISHISASLVYFIVLLYIYIYTSYITIISVLITNIITIFLEHPRGPTWPPLGHPGALASSSGTKRWSSSEPRSQTKSSPAVNKIGMVYIIYIYIYIIYIHIIREKFQSSNVVTLPGKFDHDLTVLLKPGMIQSMMVRIRLSQGTALFRVCELL